MEKKIKKYRTDSEYHGMEEHIDGEYVEYDDLIEVLVFAMNYVNSLRLVEEGFDKDDAEMIIKDFNNNK